MPGCCFTLPLNTVRLCPKTRLESCSRTIASVNLCGKGLRADGLAEGRWEVFCEIATKLVPSSAILTRCRLLSGFLSWNLSLRKVGKHRPVTRWRKTMKMTTTGIEETG